MMKSKLILLSSLPLLMTLLFTTRLEQSPSPSTLDATPTIEVASEMDLVPSDCGILAESIAIDPLIPHAIGTWPIWVSVPNVSGQAKGVLFVPDEHYQTDPRLEGWWSSKVAWFIAKSYTGEVRLEAFNIADNSPMYFSIGEQELTTLAILNPARPGGFVDGLEHWAFFPSNVIVSKAGCYRIEAEWDGGLWQQIIAVGNIEWQQHLPN